MTYNKENKTMWCDSCTKTISENDEVWHLTRAVLGKGNRFKNYKFDNIYCSLECLLLAWNKCKKMKDMEIEKLNAESRSNRQIKGEGE